MPFTLFPIDVKFFEHFGRQHKLLKEACTLLADVATSRGNRAENCKRINEIEEAGNAHVREIFRLLALTFITPIDRDDIYRIGAGQEEVLNLVRAVAVRLGLFEPRVSNAAPRDLAESLERIVGGAGELLEHIAHGRHDTGAMTAVVTAKRDADLVLVLAMGELQETVDADSGSLVNAIRWTQILDRFEMLLASAERLAYMLEEIAIKNA